MDAFVRVRIATLREIATRTITQSPHLDTCDAWQFTQQYIYKINSYESQPTMQLTRLYYHLFKLVDFPSPTFSSTTRTNISMSPSLEGSAYESTVVHLWYQPLNNVHLFTICHLCTAPVPTYQAIWFTDDTLKQNGSMKTRVSPRDLQPCPLT